tara:strand:- start:62 stop:367 length:306 start_codon:yes stop_codon:yes gene_type:complete
VIVKVYLEDVIPPAKDKLNRVNALRNGFAFLNSDIATDYTQIAILRDKIKSLKITLFLALIGISQIIIAVALLNIPLKQSVREYLIYLLEYFFIFGGDTRT